MSVEIELEEIQKPVNNENHIICILCNTKILVLPYENYNEHKCTERDDKDVVINVK